MTSATEILRRMLDECGVEYMKVDFLDGEHITSFDVNGREYGYHEFPDGGTLLRVWHPTPEQAIAATLGPCNCTNNCTNGERTNGTCHPIISDNLNESEGMGDAWADCSECGHLLFVLTDPNSEPPNYCPNCGAKVVEPTTNDVGAEVDA